MGIYVEFSYQPPVSDGLGLVQPRSDPTVRSERPLDVNLREAGSSFNALALSR
jgi:hypothetical protein